MKTANALVALLLVIGLPASGMCEEVSAPAVQTHEGITYASGGVGLGEREAMQQMAKDYNLRLSFAAKGTGTYLADIKVTIRDGKGKQVLDALSDGPWFFAKLPVGKYRVTAEEDGRPLVQKADLSGGRHAALYFYWPEHGGKP